MGKVIADLAASAASATLGVENATSSVNYVLSKTDGAAGEFLKTDGSGALSFASAAGGFDDIKVWTSSQSGYLIPAGVTKVIFFVTGGGAGGAGANALLGASGGAAGGSAIKKLVLVGGTDSIDVVVGGTASGGSAGAD